MMLIEGKIVAIAWRNEILGFRNSLKEMPRLPYSKKWKGIEKTREKRRKHEVT